MTNPQSSALPRAGLAAPLACFPLLRGAVNLRAMSQQAGEIDTPPTPELIVAVHCSGDALVEQNLGGHWRRAVLTSGDLTVLPPDVPSRWRLHGPCTFVHVAYSVRHLSALARRVGWQGQVDVEPLFGATDDSIGTLSLRAWAQLESRRPMSRPTAELAVQMILAVLLQTYGKRHDAGPAPMMSGVLRNALNHIETHLDARLTLETLAAATRSSPSTLAKAFRAHLGKSVHQYVLARRIERARALLSGTSISITEIAGLTGFGNSQHFATVFRRMAGQSPTSYRQAERRRPARRGAPT